MEPKKTIPKNTANLELNYNKASYKSVGAPILVGTDPSCDIKLQSSLCQNLKL